MPGELAPNKLTVVTFFMLALLALTLDCLDRSWFFYGAWPFPAACSFAPEAADYNLVALLLTTTAAALFGLFFSFLSFLIPWI